MKSCSDSIMVWNKEELNSSSNTAPIYDATAHNVSKWEKTALTCDTALYNVSKCGLYI